MNATVEGKEMTEKSKALFNKKYEWLAFLFLVAAFFVYQEYRAYQNTTRITGRVIDKETGKPVPYALIKMAIGYTGVGLREGKTVVANEKGEYEIVSKNVPAEYADIKTILEGRDTPRNGQQVTAWFPGYSKWAWSKEGWKLYRGKMDISLERPTTAEEAVNELRKGMEDFNSAISNLLPDDYWATRPYIAPIEKKNYNSFLLLLPAAKKVFTTASKKESKRLVQKDKGVRSCNNTLTISFYNSGTGSYFFNA